MTGTGAEAACKISFPVENAGRIFRNSSAEELLAHSLERAEGKLTDGGALVVETGAHTGRAARDKFIVRDATTQDTVWWDNNQAMSREQFETLRQDFLAHAEGRELFVQDLFAGADETHCLATQVIVEYAWHALFIRYLLRRPGPGGLKGFSPQFTVVNLPSFRADPERHGTVSQTVIACDYTNKLVLVGGTSYAGETKKSVFSYLNFMLPDKGVMPMHCSANEEGDGTDPAIFFGLSGTGKTTLSSDPKRTLLGDDEHGWSTSGIFNFEGGCYAKTIRLSREAEPEIYDASIRAGAVLENVILNDDGSPDFDDGSLTENARSAYPLEYIPNASGTGTSGHPRNIVMLTADAFGVLPPIAKLTPSQAMYHFLSGYTAKVAGTEKGVDGVQATFSTCFGAPFMPRHPSVYGNLLRELIGEHGVDCWLVNTGWTGGVYGVGHRMPIKATRALLDAALNGSLADAQMRTDPIFGFQAPLELEGVDAAILNPRETWDDKGAYDRQAKALVDMFIGNFEKFESHVDPDVREAAPVMRDAAE
ncbi:phosphoenolpyruvate carboxykinase [ATP] [bacterium BMS3Bbin10]|nr:phosphoenolpyruvate carboxykinase [ATP] [bacterium BMS3Bbin10]